MKPKVYKIAAMAVICLAVVSVKTYACQSPGPLVTLIAPITDGASTGPDNHNDTAFKKNMRKLQELQKQLSALQVFEQTDVDLDEAVQDGEAKLKNKTYSKSYTADGNDKLQIDNRYGNVTVNTWNRNEFKVDVEIKAYAADNNDAQKMLDQVKINDSKDNSVISFTTIISDRKSNFWGIWINNGKTTVRKTIINYTVYMPAKSPLTITNSYGSVILPDLSGKVTVKNTYSDLTSKALTNAESTVSVRYGNADMESFTGSNLKIAYGSLNLQWADKLNADISFSPVKIGKLSTSAIINLHYGDGLQIISLDKNLKNLSVNSSFAPVVIGTQNSDNANFDITVHGGDFSYNDGISIISKAPSGGSITQNYKGHIGKGSNDRLIVIRSNFSNVKFDQ